MRTPSTNSPSWQTLKKTQAILDASSEQMADMLELTHRDYVSLWMQNRSVPIQSALSFSRRFNLTLESFYAGDVDYTTLAQHHAGNLSYLPEKYTVGAFSKTRTVSNFLNYAESVRGEDFRSGLLRAFQIHEAALQNLDAPVNVRLVSDVAQWMRQKGFEEIDFFKIGLNTYSAHKHSPLGQALSQYKSSKTLYMDMAERHYIHFDKNVKYRLTKLTDAECVIEAYANEEVGEILKLKAPGNSDCCTQRRGVLTVLSAFGEMKPSLVLETRCLHQGDPMCRYEIRYEEARGIH